MIPTARSLAFDASTRTHMPEVETTTWLSRREATLRSAATTCLTGIALVQAIELPSLFARGGQLGVLSIAAMALCLGLGMALAVAPAGAARQLWRMVAAAAVVVLAGWGASRAFAVPGLTAVKGEWAAMPGVVSAALAAACLALAVAAVRPTRAAARSLAVALAVLVALAPGVGAVLVALGPGPAGGESSLASDVSLHALHGGSAENDLVFQPFPGGHGGQYVFRTPAIPHPTAFNVAFGLAAAFIFIYGAVAYLRRRSAPAETVALNGVRSAVA